MQDINKRLDRIEERLYKIEQKLGLDAPVPMAKPTPLAAKPAVAANQSPQLKKANTLETIKPTPTEDAVSATKILGWCAGLTFLLAMSYFLKLVYDTGWLTPERQIGLAYSAAVILILIGIVLERHDHQYASYLPAVGLVVLFLATFTAHLYIHLWARNAAIGLVSISTLTGIWLTRKFERSIYTIFAAVGVYLSPMLIHSNHPVLMDLVIFYTAWS